MTAIRIIDDHVQLANIGTKTHAQIEGHIQGIGNYAFPAADGSADQILKTNGAGVLAWIDKNHSIASHNDTTATGAELETLTDNSIADALHRHSELVASDGSPDPALSMDSVGNASFVKQIKATQIIELIGDDASYPTNIMHSYSDTSWHGCYLTNYRTRGTAASPATLVSGDLIFYFDLWGHDGSNYVRGGQLGATIDGAVSTGIVPMKWLFRTMDTTGVYATRIKIKNDGRVAFGAADPATSAHLDLVSTTGALLLTRMTTTQKNALTAANGMILYDSTLNKFQGYENGAWISLI